MPWVKNWIRLNYSFLAGRQIAIKDITGVSRTIGYTGSKMSKSWLTAYSDGLTPPLDKVGLVVGSGDDVLGSDAYSLSNQILHAWPATPGTLYHVTGALFSTPTTPDNYSETWITRELINYSGAPIIVREVALYVAAPDTSGTARYFMVYRSILDTPVTAAGGTTTPPPGPLQTIIPSVRWRAYV
jgi:hypothetical protein